MLEYHDSNLALRNYRRRLAALAAIILAVFAALAVRLFWLQIIEHDRYEARAEDNRIYIAPLVPLRGEIRAADDTALAINEPVYALEVYPAKAPQLKNLVAEIASVISLSATERSNFFKLVRDYKGVGGIPLKVRLSERDMAAFAGQSYRFPSVSINANFLRYYPYSESVGHVVGYLTAITENDRALVESKEDQANNYKGNILFGRSGLENEYEFELHGTSGSEIVEVDSFGRPQRQLRQIPSTPGDTLKLSLDIGMQKVAHTALGDRRGAVVAIEPQTGRVLALVSTPSIDANQFIGGISNEAWAALNNSVDKPLLNRAIAGTYPPGSTFKPYLALAALDSGMRRPQDITYDPGYYRLGNVVFRDFKKEGHGAVDMFKSIVESCDTYYYKLAHQMGIDRMDHYAAMFGFGRETGVDMPGELSGLLPTREWKEKRFPGQKWYDGDSIPLGVGQGYHNYTPIQMAVAVAALANGGTLHVPRLVDGVMKAFPRVYQPSPSLPSQTLPFKKQDIEFIRKAMAGVNRQGTAAAFASAPYTSAGKTGTAQVFGLKGKKYIASQVRERLRDHALYIGFAPLENPTIALAVIVENGGFGGSSAVPVARKVMDYYLLKSSTAEAKTGVRVRQDGNGQPADTPVRGDTNE